MSAWEKNKGGKRKRNAMSNWACSFKQGAQKRPSKVD